MPNEKPLSLNAFVRFTPPTGTDIATLFPHDFHAANRPTPGEVGEITALFGCTKQPGFMEVQFAQGTVYILPTALSLAESHAPIAA